MAHADPRGQSCGRHAQGDSQPACNRRAAYVTQGEASGLSDPCCDRAGQTGAAPEPVAAWRTKQTIGMKWDNYHLTDEVNSFASTASWRLNATKLVFVVWTLTGLGVITAGEEAGVPVCQGVYSHCRAKHKPTLRL